MAEISTLKRGAKSEGFASLSEEEVALAAKSGNQDATEWIVNRYKEFIKMRSHTFYLAGADQEDVMQEGMLGLYKAILGFEDDKGASFKTFAELCINRQLQRFAAIQRITVPSKTFLERLNLGQLFS